VGVTDSRQRSDETNSSFFPHPEEQISTGYSSHFKGTLMSERSEFQRRIHLAEKKQEHLDEAIADHTARILAEELALLAKEQKRKELAQEQERLELTIADHVAKIEAENLAKDQKENELREWKISRMTNMDDLDVLDKMIRRGNVS
jgi:hypothetical protein